MPDNYLNNVVTRLRQGLLTTDTVMRVKVGDGIKFSLPIGDYAYVTLRDRLNYEVVRYQIAGTVPVSPLPNPPVSPGDDIVIIRAQDDTTAKQFPVGTCVTIEWNDAQLLDTVNQIAETHEARIAGIAPITVTNLNPGTDTQWQISIDDVAFEAQSGTVDPTIAPPVDRSQFYVNTITNDAWMWVPSLTAWLLLTPNVTVGIVDPVAAPVIGQSPLYVNTATQRSFAWTQTPTPGWVPLVPTSPVVDLSPYATIAAMNAGDASTASTAAANLAAAVSVLNSAISSAGALQNVSATLPIVSSGGANPVISHAASGASAGTYDQTTVNALGHVIGGTLLSPASSQAASGSITFGNGLIIKWGSVALNNPSGVSAGSDSELVTYPNPFPTAPLSVMVTPRVETSLNGFEATLGSTTSFTMTAGFGPGGFATLGWFAVGY